MRDNSLLSMFYFSKELHSYDKITDGQKLESTEYIDTSTIIKRTYDTNFLRTFDNVNHIL